jgi:hypothetical protein
VGAPRRSSREARGVPPLLYGYEDQQVPRANPGGGGAHLCLTAGDAPSLTALPHEPSNYLDALRRPDSQFWRDAMDKEVAALLANNTWEADTPSLNTKVIPTMFVYKLKRSVTGAIEQYKARLVAKGFHQVSGLDVFDVFAPVSRYTTLRTVLALAVERDYYIGQIDVKNAFVQGALDDEVWIRPPPGYNLCAPGEALRLNKALYGLKQAPRVWHAALSAKLTAYGFKPSAADPSLFMKGSTYLLTYVDEILVFSPTEAEWCDVKNYISTVFDVRVMPSADRYLGISLIRRGDSITLSHAAYISELTDKYGLTGCAIKDTPISPGTKLSRDEGEPLDCTRCPYSSLVGALLFLSTTTRPDIAFAVSALSRFMAKPSVIHWEAAKRVLRYLAGTPHLGLTFSPVTTGLSGLCDSDYAACVDSRRSTTGFVFMLNSTAVSWGSKLQPTVAASTTEAEYMAAAAAIREALWLRTLLSDLGYSSSGPIEIRGDNQATLKLLHNPVITPRSKHIDVLHHFARERVVRGEVALSFVPTANNWADALTKPLTAAKFAACRAGFGMA